MFGCAQFYDVSKDLVWGHEREREREREKGYRFDNNEAQAAMCKHAEQLISRIIGFPFLELHLSGL